MKDRSLVRASDIGVWAFCQRAWWLANVKEVPHQNPAVFQRGNAMHLTHGRTMRRARSLQQVGTLLLGLALLLAGVALLWWALR